MHKKSYLLFFNILILFLIKFKIIIKTLDLKPYFNLSINTWSIGGTYQCSTSLISLEQLLRYP